MPPMTARVSRTSRRVVGARRALVLVAWAVAGVLGLAVAAHAQSSGDEPTLEQRLRLQQLLAPDPTKEIRAPSETERSQEEARRAQDRARRAPDDAQPSRGPGYVGPLSTETRTGRMGVSGWTSPAITTPGSGGTPEEKAGQFGFGYSVEWGAPRSSSEAP